MRLTGLASGLDTDTLVKQMMQPYKMKVDKARQDSDFIKIKQDLYRGINKDLRALYSKYFSTTSDNSLIMTKSYKNSTFTSSKPGAVSAEGLLGAKVGNYKVKVDTVAQPARCQVDAGKLSDQKLNIVVDEGASYANHKTVEVNLEGITESADIVKKINEAFKNAGVNTTASTSTISGQIVIETKGTGSTQNISIQNMATAGTNLPAEMKVSCDSIKGKIFEVNVNGTIKKVDLTDPSLTTNDQILAKVNSDLGAVAKVENDGTTGIKISTIDTGSGVKISASVKVEMASGVGTDTSEATVGINLVNNLKGKNTSVNVNGKEINLDLTSMTGNTDAECVTKIQELVGSDATVSFTNGIVTFTTNDKGAAQSIKLTTYVGVGTSKDGENGYGQILGNSGSDIKGTITDTYGNKGAFGYTENECKTLGAKNMSDTIKGNTFTVDNVQFTISDVTSGEEALVSGKTDSSAFVKNIKEFATEYNKIIEDIEKKLGEKKQYTYKPLTEEQKKDMKEEDIKNWNEKVKQGLLKRDDILSGLTSELREAFFTPLEGSGINLKDIGISFNDDYLKPGQLEIDETKLSEAFEKDSDAVYNLFNQSAPSSVSDSDKFKNTGIMQRVKDIINKTAVSSNSSLVLKAGYENAKEFNNSMTEDLMKRETKLKEMEKGLTDRENAFYLQFSKLEKAMNQLNSQQSWLAQQLGGAK